MYIGVGWVELLVQYNGCLTSRCQLLVVGGGSGGCSMAAKFARKLKKNAVIILEPSSVSSCVHCSLRFSIETLGYTNSLVLLGQFFVSIWSSQPNWFKKLSSQPNCKVKENFKFVISTQNRSSPSVETKRHNILQIKNHSYLFNFNTRLSSFLP